MSTVYLDDSDEDGEQYEYDEPDSMDRTKSTGSIGNFDITESNILNTLFDGIPIKHVGSKTLSNDNKHKNKNKANINDPHNLDNQHHLQSNNIDNTDTDNFINDFINNEFLPKKNKLNVVNVPSVGHTQNLIVSHTGFREADELRIIFKERPLGIQIKPLNDHGFDAQISKISKLSVIKQGVEEGMIITGLNNKDLLGCTYNQIMNIIKSSTLPITLRLKKINNNIHHVYDNDDDDDDDDDDDGNKNGMSSVDWHNIRLGASLIKYGMTLDIDNETDQSAFDFAYLQLKRAGLNLYEIRAAIRLIREQPQCVPLLETYKKLSITNSKRLIHNRQININPKFVPSDWLKEQNLLIHNNVDDDINNNVNKFQIITVTDLSESDTDNDDDDDYDYDNDDDDDDDGYDEDDEEEEEEDDYQSTSSLSTTMSSGPKTSDLQQCLKEMEEKEQLKEKKQINQYKSNIHYNMNQLKQNNNDIDNKQQNKQSQKLMATLKKPSKRYNKHKEKLPINLPLTPNYSNNSKTFKKPMMTGSRASNPYYISTTDHDHDPTSQINQINPIIAPKAKPHIGGYVDFFDDNETSISQSQSISHSIQVQQLYDAIGLQSPPIENMVDILYSTDDDINDINDINNNNNLPIFQGIGTDQNGNVVLFDKNGNVINTPDVHLNENNINFDNKNIKYIDDSSDDNDDGYQTDESNLDTIDNIGVSSYIQTEYVDMIDDEFIVPQVMLKYNPLNIHNMNSSPDDTLSDFLSSNNNNNTNNTSRTNKIINKIKNIRKKSNNTQSTTDDDEKSTNFTNDDNKKHKKKLMGLKESIKQLNISTNMKNMFKKMSSPKPSISSPSLKSAKSDTPPGPGNNK